jgi:hypothetical protein
MLASAAARRSELRRLQAAILLLKSTAFNKRLFFAQFPREGLTAKP